MRATTLLTLVAAGLGTAGLLAGCVPKPPVKGSIGRDSPFCRDVAGFRDATSALALGLPGDSATAQSELTSARELMTKLQREAPGDNVDGHRVGDDLALVGTTFDRLAQALVGVDPKDPAAVARALGPVAKTGDAVSKATRRLDRYASDVCGVTATTATTLPASGPTSSTSAPAVVGPVGPTTPASTTASTPASTTAPGSTTSSP